MREIFSKLKEDISILIDNAHRDAAEWCEEQHETIPPVIPPPQEGFKWGFINPHTESAKGAYTKSEDDNEYEYGLRMRDEINAPWETRDIGGVYGAASRLGEQGCTASIEPHLNAFNHRVEGHEFLVLQGDARSEKEARKMQAAYAERYPKSPVRYDNGILFVKYGDRGYQNLVKAKSAGMEVAVLSETFFIDNPDDYIDSDEMAQFWNSYFRL